MLNVVRKAWGGKPIIRQIPLPELIERLQDAPPTPEILAMLEKARELQKLRRG
jgi:hypothetical protein